MAHEINDVVTQFKPLWFLVSAGAGFCLAVIYSLRYKFPDIIKRTAALENSIKKKVAGGDLDSAIDGIRTICRFNQVCCQKENQAHLSKAMRELDKKIELLYEKLNNISIISAKLSATVELLLVENTI